MAKKEVQSVHKWVVFVLLTNVWPDGVRGPDDRF